MKKILTLTALMFSLSLFSQTRISLTQDARLAVIGDNKGNDAFTPNLTFRLSQAFVKGDYFNPFFAFDYEYANLAGGLYERAGFGIGINIPIGQKIELQSHLSSGFIFRHGKKYSNYEIVGNFAYKIKEKLSIILEAQRTYRSDLSPDIIRYSGKIGLRLEISNTPLFKN